MIQGLCGHVTRCAHDGLCCCVLFFLCCVICACSLSALRHLALFEGHICIDMLCFRFTRQYSMAPFQPFTPVKQSPARRDPTHLSLKLRSSRTGLRGGPARQEQSNTAAKLHCCNKATYVGSRPKSGLSSSLRDLLAPCLGSYRSSGSGASSCRVRRLLCRSRSDIDLVYNKMQGRIG